MSLEESMKVLAESNNKLADAQNKHTDALLKYIDFQISGGNAEATTTNAASGEPAAKRTRGPNKPKEQPAPAAEEAAEEADPFGDEAEEEAAPELTAETIRALVMKVKDKDKNTALALLKKVGADTVAKIDPKQYPKVVELAAKVGVTL